MKKRILIICLICASPFQALADSATLLEAKLPAILQGAKENPLVKLMQQAETDTLTKLQVEKEKEITRVQPIKRNQNDSETSETISKLVDEVDRLKTKVVVTKHNILSTENPRQKSRIGAKTFYTYREGEIYEVHAGVDNVTDIELQPGEELSNSPVSGDTVRWKIAVLESGSPQGQVTHLIVKPLEEGIDTNIIVTTQRRVYHLRALSSDWHMPAVAWSYPEDEARELEAKLRKKEEVEPLSLKPESLRFDYEIDGDDLKWKPIRVFDDGLKTYIHMPTSIAASEAPAFFVIEEDGEPQLVNYRVKGTYYIVDRLFSRGELRVGPKLKVEITSSDYNPSLWERLF